MAAAQGAKDFGGLTIGFTHDRGKPNECIDVTVDCLKYSDAIPFDADYGIRLMFLMACDHFVFTAGKATCFLRDARVDLPTRHPYRSRQC